MAFASLSAILPLACYSQTFGSCCSHRSCNYAVSVQVDLMNTTRWWTNICVQSPSMAAKGGSSLLLLLPLAVTDNCCQHSYFGVSQEHCKLDFACGLICCQLSRAAICACLTTDVCTGSVILELWVMRGTCSLSALLLRISGTTSLHWLQNAQVLGLRGPMVSRYMTTCLDKVSC